jgi:hypothetical protein
MVVEISGSILEPRFPKSQMATIKSMAVAGDDPTIMLLWAPTEIYL